MAPKSLSRSIRLSIATLASVLLFGCAGTTQVEIDVAIPNPLIRELPLTAGVYWAPDLDEFIYDEKIAKYGTYKVALQDSQSHMFETALDALFEELVPVESFDSRPEGLDLLIIPRILELQIAIPQQTRTDLYEVWVRYSLELYQPDGTPIHEYRFAGYGKVNRQNYSVLSRPAYFALREATHWALRDAVASISFFLVKQAPVASWLKANGISA